MFLKIPRHPTSPKAQETKVPVQKQIKASISNGNFLEHWVIINIFVIKHFVETNKYNSPSITICLCSIIVYLVIFKAQIFLFLLKLALCVKFKKESSHKNLWIALFCVFLKMM